MWTDYNKMGKTNGHILFFMSKNNDNGEMMKMQMSTSLTQETLILVQNKDILS